MIAGSSLDIDATGLLLGLHVAGYVAVFGLGALIGWAMGSVSSADRCGCQACKAVAHSSHCAVHNGPALPVGACNCGALGRREALEFIARRIEPKPASAVAGSLRQDIPALALGSRAP